MQHHNLPPKPKPKGTPIGVPPRGNTVAFQKGNPIAVPRGTMAIPKGTPIPKGNVIGVPTNVSDASRTDVRVVHEVKTTPVLAGSNQTRRTAQRATQSPREGQNLALSQWQREQAKGARAGHDEFLQHPGELKSVYLDVNMKTICNHAFVAYETLFSLPTHPLSVTTLTWGSALDISTVRLHYGSTYFSEESKKTCPVGSCLTVEMRKYGDSASTHEMISLRDREQLLEPGDAFVEGVNISMRGPIYSMKCLESGHLVTYNQYQGLIIWDMKDDPEAAKVAVAKLGGLADNRRHFFDVKRMSLCCVDRAGKLTSYELTNSISSTQATYTASIKPDLTARIDKKQHSFECSSIARHEFDPLILIGSDNYAQVALYDERTSTPAQPFFTSLSCRRRDLGNDVRVNGPKSWDSIHGVEWNPHREHEFMTVSRNVVRIWDRRNMSSDLYAKPSSLEYDWIRKAKWSPHRKDVIADLTIEGRVGIWKLDNPEGPEGNKGEMIEPPERLFLHEASLVGFSDFEWCPHIEDVLATVAPGGLDTENGCIQVWRPRNLMDLDDFGEP